MTTATTDGPISFKCGVAPTITSSQTNKLHVYKHHKSYNKHIDVPPSPFQLLPRNTMAEQQVIKSERKLRGIVLREGGTEDGYNWLESALDPFHDKTVPLRGYPDTQTSSSVVQLVKQSLTVTSPPGTVANWDCHIASLPVVSGGTAKNSPFLRVSQILDSSGRATNIINAVGSTGFPTTPYMGLQVLSGPSGSSLDVSFPSFPSLSQAQNLILPNQYWSDAARVIGIGFEVTNVTAPLTVQGAVTVYRLPVNPYNTCSTINYVPNAPAVVTPNSLSAVYQPSIPSTTAGALLLYGSKQWKAADGCYCVNTFNTQEISENCANSIQPIVYLNTVNDSQVFMPTPPVAFSPGAGQFVAFDTSFWANINIAGAFFTGLSPSTTLIINYNIYIERFPSTLGGDLTVMAQPSPGYDPTVLELYAKAVRELPVGVPVCENDLGDWFSSAVSAVSDAASSFSRFAAPVMSVIPQTRALGMAMTAGNQMIDAYRGNKQHFDAQYAPTRLVRQPRLISNPTGEQRTQRKLARNNSPSPSANVGAGLVSSNSYRRGTVVANTATTPPTIRLSNKRPRGS
jgi:hypothetical protein